MPTRHFSAGFGWLKEKHREFPIQAMKAVNTGLTLRNIFIGFYIEQYQLKGSDRAQYGETLFEKLSKELKSRNISFCR